MESPLYLVSTNVIIHAHNPFISIHVSLFIYFYNLIHMCVYVCMYDVHAIKRVTTCNARLMCFFFIDFHQRIIIFVSDSRLYASNWRDSWTMFLLRFFDNSSIELQTHFFFKHLSKYNLKFEPCVSHVNVLYHVIVLYDDPIFYY